LSPADFRTRIGQALHRVVLGEPVAMVAQPIGGASELDRRVNACAGV
jgi:hypothetical protein